MNRVRGRPPKFNEADVLRAAAEVFWAKGFDGASLDDLAEAMDMNRPSIYRAFGDKQALYRRALDAFAKGMEQGMQAAFSPKTGIKRAFRQFYGGALDVYTAGVPSKGCMVMSTAATAAVGSAAVRADLADVIRIIDKGMERRLKRAVEESELPPDFDVKGRALVAQSILHGLSLRARAGDSRANLNRLVNTGVDLILS